MKFFIFIFSIFSISVFSGEFKEMPGKIVYGTYSHTVSSEDFKMILQSAEIHKKGEDHVNSEYETLFGMNLNIIKNLISIEIENPEFELKSEYGKLKHCNRVILRGVPRGFNLQLYLEYLEENKAECLQEAKELLVDKYTFVLKVAIFKEDLSKK